MIEDYEVELPLKPHTTVHDRYQVTDSVCGLVTTATSLKKASALAESHAAKHGREVDNTVTMIEVFDCMARRDCMDTWQFNVASAQSAA